jgi:hypothetical protein
MKDGWDMSEYNEEKTLTLTMAILTLTLLLNRIMIANFEWYRM